MRHRKGFNHLGRKSAHRKAMLSNMASSLIMHKRITTTVAKAKALRIYVEPLITTHSRRVVFSYLQDKNAVSELFRDVATKVAERPGGYTRILKTGNRLGDNADMCIIELVDYNENLLDTGKAKSKSKRRRGSKKKTDDAAPQLEAAKITEDVVVEETIVDEVKTEEPEAEVKSEELKAEAETEEAKVEETTTDETKTEEETVAEAKEEAPAKEEKVEEEPKAETMEETKAEAPAEEEKPEEDNKEEEKKDEN